MPPNKCFICDKDWNDCECIITKPKPCKCRTELQKEMIGVKDFPTCYSCEICGQDVHCKVCQNNYKQIKEIENKWKN